MHTIVLAYSKENKAQAKKIDQQLSVDGLQFEHITCDQVSSDTNWSDILGRQNNKPVFLFISDNFLKAQACMNDGLKIIHQIQDNKNIHPLIIDGVETDEETGEQKAIPILFDRVSNVIQYMNFWQERYLEVRKLKRNATPENEEEVNRQVTITRAISTEIGEFLRLLRSTEYITYEQLSSENFAAFFHLAGVPHQLQERFMEKPTVEENNTVTVEQPALVHEKKTKTSPKVVTTPMPSEIPVLEAKESQTPASGFQHGHKAQPEPSVELLQSLFDEEEEEPKVQKTVTKNKDIPLDDVDLDAEEIEIDLSRGTSPIDANELLHQARHFLHEGQSDKAFKVYEKILLYEPTNLNARYQYSIALANQGKNVNKAMEQMEVITKEDPTNIQAFKKLAEYAEAINDFLLAKTYYEKIYNIDPTADGIPYKLGVINLNFFSEQPKVAASYFKAAIKQNKKHVDAHYQYAIIMSEYLGKYEKAIRHFNKTLDLHPRHTFANYDLALLYHKISNHRLAAKYYKRAYTINPELKTEENDAAFFFPFPEAESDNLDFLGRSPGSPPPQESSVPLADLVEDRIPDQPAEAKEKLVIEEVPAVQAAPKLKGPQTGKIIWITGATSGIGKATAQVFAEHGYSLVLTGRRSDRLEELKQTFQAQSGYEVQTLSFDIRDREAVKACIDKLPKEWQDCDILINNAGLAAGFGPIHEGNIDDWDTMINTNVKGLLYMTRLISPGMVERKRGHIINIASTAGKEVYPGGSVYCASKFAVEALTKAMRLDLYKFGIKVSQVAPGHVEDTEFAEVRFHGDKERAKIYEDFQPLKSRDVAETLYFIATRPPHVNIQDVLMMGTQQASNIFIDRSGREK